VEKYWVLFMILAGVVIAVAALAGQYLREEEMRKRWRAVADREGFSFLAEGDAALWHAVDRFPLFSRGRARKMTNVLRKNVEGRAVWIFDYRFTIGSGKHSHTHRQTVAVFESEQNRLPWFTLRPEGLFAKLGSFLGQQDIDFERHPAFSDAYLLQGEDEARIRKVFTDRVLSYYAGRSGLCTEGGGPRIVCYRAGQRIAPERVDAFLRQGLEVVDLFWAKEEAPQDLDGLDRVLAEAQSVLGGLAASRGA
jgi:hypothetical protein